MSQPSPAEQPSAAPVLAVAALGEADWLVTVLRNRTYQLATESQQLRDLVQRQEEAIAKLKAEVDRLNAEKTEKAK